MKIAIITGASSGMGRQFVHQSIINFKDLDEIWIIARRKERLLDLENYYKDSSMPKIKSFCMDLDDKNSIQDLKDILEAKEPKVKILVNAAGMGKYGPFFDASYDEAISTIQLNCVSLTAITHIVLPYMIPNGIIFQIASSAAFLPQPNFAIYAASKSFVLSFSRALNKELKYKKIHSIAVCPGPVSTEFLDKMGKQMPEFKKKFIVSDKAVVKKAIRDGVKGKDMSVYGLSMKAILIFGKIIPHKWILNFIS